MILRADPDQSSPNKTELGLRLSCNLRKTVVFIEIRWIGIVLFMFNCSCRYMFMFISIPAEFTGSLAMSMWTTWLVHFVDCVNILFYIAFIGWMVGIFGLLVMIFYDLQFVMIFLHLALLQLLLLQLVHILFVPSVAKVVRLDYDIKVVLKRHVWKGLWWRWQWIPSCNPDLRERSYNTDKHSMPPREPAERCQLGTLLWSSRW